MDSAIPSLLIQVPQELEKLISYSGTPTAVWRRTGEICLAGDEFCRLTEFHRSDLLGKKTFIYELFEKQSCAFWRSWPFGIR